MTYDTAAQHEILDSTTSSLLVFKFNRSLWMAKDPARSVLPNSIDIALLDVQPRLPKEQNYRRVVEVAK